MIFTLYTSLPKDKKEFANSLIILVLIAQDLKKLGNYDFNFLNVKMFHFFITSSNLL